MPDIEVTYDQSKAILNWVKNRGGKLITQVPTFHNTVPGTGVYGIDGEPFLLEGILFTNYGAHVVCSDKHAQELEQSGIVDFGLAKPSDAQVTDAVRGALESLNQ